MKISRIFKIKHVTALNSLKVNFIFDFTALAQSCLRVEFQLKIYLCPSNEGSADRRSIHILGIISKAT